MISEGTANIHAYALGKLDTPPGGPPLRPTCPFPSHSSLTTSSSCLTSQRRTERVDVHSHAAPSHHTAGARRWQIESTVQRNTNESPHVADWNGREPAGCRRVLYERLTVKITLHQTTGHPRSGPRRNADPSPATDGRCHCVLDFFWVQKLQNHVRRRRSMLANAESDVVGKT